MVLCGAVLSLAAAVTAWSFWGDWKKQQSYKVTAEYIPDSQDGYRSLTWRGEEYEYNNAVTSILFAGIDTTEPLEAAVSYGNHARADSIFLAVMDRGSGKLSVIAVSRDTMTYVRRFGRDGTDLGTYVTHLGYAYSNGDGGEASCRNLCEAVSDLFYVPVTEYAVTNIPSLTEINDFVGGVTVTVPNDDLAGQYPEMTEGSVVTLDESNVSAFVRYRDTGEDFSNAGRLERQKAYVSAYIGRLKDKLSGDIEAAWEETLRMEDAVQTSITRNKYLTMARLFEEVSFEDADYYILEGENRTTEMYDEFYPDIDALEELVIDLFYRKVS